jgi:hypothetical protein
LEHALATYVNNICNICNIQIKKYNVQMKIAEIFRRYTFNICVYPLQHPDKTNATSG